MQQVTKKAAGMHASTRVPTAGEGIHHCYRDTLSRSFWTWLLQRKHIGLNQYVTVLWFIGAIKPAVRTLGLWCYFDRSLQDFTTLSSRLQPQPEFHDIVITAT